MCMYNTRGCHCCLRTHTRLFDVAQGANLQRASDGIRCQKKKAQFHCSGEAASADLELRTNALADDVAKRLEPET